MILCRKLVLYPGTEMFDRYAKPKGVTVPCYVKYSPDLQDLWDTYRKAIHESFSGKATDHNMVIDEEIFLF